ncbi:hypothetical protein AVEN_83063-1 [Araneus ventricosus]|uniref:Uncharacterized protein n=1 Tax=Araneus ventricosus TaxID=182803 RepID=A0A4Y2AMK6_ARAVE|nr:hypothetical protein AVEN_83063-1 [Araneus ventricosus]
MYENLSLPIEAYNSDEECPSACWPETEMTLPPEVEARHDSNSDKEAADMGCKQQQMKFSTQNILEKIDDIIAHSSTTTDETIGVYFSK